MGVKHKTIIAQPAADAEYVAACKSCLEGQSVKTLLSKEFSELYVYITLGINNQASFVMAANPTCNRRI